MDHLMPGMDGFQAVQAIKADPEPPRSRIMMYTSQEGELYVSQARALGAVGVLPKTVKPADVSRVLYQLHLLPDGATQRQPSPGLRAQESLQSARRRKPSRSAKSRPRSAARDRLVLKEHSTEMRRFSAREPGSLSTLHGTQMKPAGRAGAAARAHRRTTAAAAAEPLAAGCRDRRARAAADVRAHCPPVRGHWTR